MSYDYELDTQQTFLPGFYSIDITAILNGYTSLTRTFVINVELAQAGDTIRTLADLLANIWRDGQSSRELTTQDVRDTIVSLALQTGNFSDLPTQKSDASFGHVYVDQGVLMVNLDTPAVNHFATAAMAGAGILASSPVAAILGTTLDGGVSTFSGSTTVITGVTFGFAGMNGSASFSVGNPAVFRNGTATLYALSGFSARPIQIGQGRFTGSGLISALGDVVLGAGGAFSGEFSSAFDKAHSSGGEFSIAFGSAFTGVGPGGDAFANAYSSAFS